MSPTVIKAHWTVMLPLSVMDDWISVGDNVRDASFKAWAEREAEKQGMKVLGVDNITSHAYYYSCELETSGDVMLEVL